MTRPWSLQPDRFSLYPPEEWSEGYIFETVREKYILGDEGRTVELHHVQGLDHVAGMLIAYFPNEKLVEGYHQIGSLKMRRLFSRTVSD